MFESGSSPSGDAAVAALRDSLRRLPAPADDAARIARLRALEELKAAVAAAQVRETATFAASQRAEQRALGVEADRVGRGIAHQVALALRISPHRAQRYVGWATVLTNELPRTFRALAEGRTTEWRTQLVAKETIWLSRADRAAVDRDMAARIEGLGDRAVEGEVRKLAYRLDRQGFVDRLGAAEKDRRVTVRPAPDTMARLTGLLPVAQGVAAYAALSRTADTLIAQGDDRTRGQIMADTLVERVTGQATASDVPVEINLIMTDRSLLAGDPEPAVLDGFGPLPAATARELVSRPGDAVPVWLRQLYSEPGTGRLVAMQTRRRNFGPAQRQFVRNRDQYCRTPWCGAPIRHVDHVEPVQSGGVTAVANAQGYCAACNYAKEAPGWRTSVAGRGSGDEVVVLTPTGHRYSSRPPSGPGQRAAPSPFERRFVDYVFAA
jgi:Domain of unknown function (DUF222)